MCLFPKVKGEKQLREWRYWKKKMGIPKWARNVHFVGEIIRANSVLQTYFRMRYETFN
jgi:hypothetical protein